MKLISILVTVALVSSPVMAQEHRGHNGGWQEHGGWHGPRSYSGGGSYGFPGGVLGGVLGGIFANTFFPPQPQVVIVPQVPEMVPYTPAWYQYCSSKYRSFNPQTGMFLGFDGQLRMCQ